MVHLPRWRVQHGYGDCASPPLEAWVSSDKIPRDYADELAGCFAMYAPGLFGYACVLAALLVRDTPTAEEVVQDSFLALCAGWDRLGDAENALAYLRQAVVNRSRSVLRHRTVAGQNLQQAPPDMPPAEHEALAFLDQPAVAAVLRELPERQREAIVLRYYADLSEAEIAATMRISRGAVKSHTARGMAALRAALEQTTPQPSRPQDSGDAGCP